MTLERGRPEIPPEHPQAYCTRQTLTVLPDVLAKAAQKHHYPSAARRRRRRPLRRDRWDGASRCVARWRAPGSYRARHR